MITSVPYASYADKVQPLENVVNFAKSGGDYTTVTEALTTINDASASNPYVIHVAPSVYLENPGIDFDGDANIDYLELKSHVDIEGSGEGVTILHQAGSASVTQATNAEVRFLTVESDGRSHAKAAALYTSGTTANFRLTYVTTTALTAPANCDIICLIFSVNFHMEVEF